MYAHRISRNLDLSIGLGMFDWTRYEHDAQSLVEVNESLIDELQTIVCNNGVWDTKPTYNIFTYEVFHTFHRDVD